MKVKKIPPWILAKGNGVICNRCGEFEKIPLPMPIDAFTPWCQYFGEKHKYCKEIKK
jgi:hypothetical protein